MKTNIMSQNTIIGGWSAWSFKPDAAATQVFENSLGKLLGVKYTLVAAASQLVNGTNYVFLCEAEMVAPAGIDYIVVANVYQPLQGEPHISGIKAVGPKPAPVPGGWQSWQFTVSPDAEKVFDEATRSLLGVRYQPLANTSQVVAGANYCFLCEATPSVLKPAPYPALVYIYQPLSGAPVVEEIDSIPQYGNVMAMSETA
jgi:hypothetical protein